MLLAHALKVDDIVTLEDRDKASEFECLVCYSIPATASAVQTFCCGTIFCRECLGPVEACPTCRTGFSDGKYVGTK